MSSLRQLDNRMKSVQATRKMTSSMKVVALSRLKKKHADFLEAVPYADAINRVVRRLVRSIKFSEDEKKRKRMPAIIEGNGKNQRYLIIPITSDEGLSGSSSLQILQQTERVISYLRERGKDIQIIAFGSRGGEAIKRSYPDITEIVPVHQQNSSYERAEQRTKRVLEYFKEDRFDVCLVIYQRFHSIVLQSPYVEQMIPMMTFLKENPWDFLSDWTNQENTKLKKSSFISVIGGAKILPSLDNVIFRTNLEGGKRLAYVYDYEPSDTGILNSIIKGYLTAYIYRLILESEVSDNAARLMAMDNATRNAGDMIDKLTKMYRRQRQSRITTDIAEVTSGKQKENEK